MKASKQAVNQTKGKQLSYVLKHASPEIGGQHAQTSFQLHTLQHTLGNRAVSRILQSTSPLLIQAKLINNGFGDLYEQEADRVAKQVMDKPISAQGEPLTNSRLRSDDLKNNSKINSLLETITPLKGQEEQKQNANGREETKHPLQVGDEYSSDDAVLEKSDLETTLRISQGLGSPLPNSVLNFMQPRFGVNFDQVRIHTGIYAQRMNQNIGAKAFTQGNHIFFGIGYGPHHLELTAHELTHVLQQTGGILNQDSSQHLGSIENREKSEFIAVSDFPKPTLTNPVQAKLAIQAKLEPGKQPACECNKAPTQTCLIADTKTGFGKQEKGEDEVALSSEDLIRSANKSSDSKKSKPFLTYVASNKAKLRSNKQRSKIAPTESITAKLSNVADNDLDFQQAKALLNLEAGKQKKHTKSEEKRIRTEVEQASALSEGNQKSQNAKETNTDEMATVSAKQQKEGKDFSAEEFIKELKQRINEKNPTTESEARKISKNPPLSNFEENFSNNIADKQDTVIKPLREIAKLEPMGGKADKEEIKLPNPKFPPMPKPVEPKWATPKPLADSAISLVHESKRLDVTMDNYQLTEAQLADSQEPSFIKALGSKREAQQKITETPGEYRKQEALLLETVETKTSGLLSTELETMGKIRRGIGNRIHGQQKDTEAVTEKRQLEIKGFIDGIYQETVTKVKCTLECMANNVKQTFANSLKTQKEVFNKNVTSRLSDYYTTGRKIKHFFLGEPLVVVNKTDGTYRELTVEERFGLVKAETINPRAYKIFLEEKEKFLTAMNAELTAIAKNVQTGLAQAFADIQCGKKLIHDYKRTLKGDEKKFADTLESDVLMKFENLESNIDDVREDLIQTLTEQYNDGVDQLETTFTDINNELKQTWVDKAVDFIKTVGKVIVQLAELLYSVLTRMAHLVVDIIQHPIRFFKTLVSGLKQGIGQFVGNISMYLENAFWTWITGATSVKNMRLSARSGTESLFNLVLQVLRLAPADLKVIAGRVLGPDFIRLVEQGVEFGEKAIEPVSILLAKGPLPFWHYLKDTLSEVIQSNFERIKESVFYSFVEKGLKWIAGFFIPGGGFIKVVKAIFSAFQFIADNLDNIRHLFDSIFDSMDAAIAGRTEGVANKIITGLKTGVVLALDFLAKQLGLNKIVDKVQSIIHALRRPVVNAIEWVLGKAKPTVRKLMQAGTKAWAQGKAKAVAAGKAVAQAGLPKDPHQRLELGLTAAVNAVNALRGIVTASLINPVLKAIKVRYGFKTLKPVDVNGNWWVEGEINPRNRMRTTQSAESQTEQSASTSTDGVRELANRALENQLTDVSDKREAQKIMGQVAERLQPDGLMGLELGPELPEGIVTIHEKESSKEPLGALVAKAKAESEEMQGKATVRTAVKLKLSEAITPTTGLIEATHTGKKAHGGIVLKSDNTDEMGIVTQNITAFTSKNPSDHAEDQFINWLLKEKDIMSKIVEIQLQNFDLSPCDDCCGRLKQVLEDIRAAQKGNPKLKVAEIYWQKPYQQFEGFQGHHSASQTTWNGIKELSNWDIYAPRDAFPIRSEEIMPEDIYKRWTYKRKSKLAKVESVKSTGASAPKIRKKVPTTNSG